ncbi:acyl-CoA carboxylase subunit beta [Dactylosporangium sp. CA-092794]|uniref:acyl-CoA carboxylase subunit beta n=1 Tax=Dactylosporangium sp. CA-092794 TaxID=3239929 RepID=UPI003D8E8A24
MRRLCDPGQAETAAGRRQHPAGKRTARERVAMLVDDGSFVEVDALARPARGADAGGPDRRGDGVVAGYATVDGRPVCVFSEDFSVFGGTLGEVSAGKIIKVMDMALRVGCPIIGINDGGGARIQEGVVAMGMFAEIFYRNVQASGVVPQISLILGPCAGGAAYSPAITDFTIMVEGISRMFLTGPDVIRAVTGESVSLDELGGAAVHSSTSGNAHYLARDEPDAIAYVQDLLAYLPSNNLDAVPRRPGAATPATGPADLELDLIVPAAPNQPYDMHEVIVRLLDDGDFLEVSELFAANVIVGFGRIDGRSVGIVANQPMRLAGCLDIDAAEKAARFVRTCDAFNVPVVSLVDVPGFLPGTQQEWAGIIRRGAKLIYAYAEATVPLITVITRKAYGAGYDVMGSKHLRADLNFAWPTAEIAVMGAGGAVNIIHRRELAAASDPDGLRARLVADYEDRFGNPYAAADRGYLDEVIEPSATRHRLAAGLRLLENKRVIGAPRKHGNIPL